MNRLSTASTLNDSEHRGFASGRSDNAKTFKRAMRHSRHVRMLRIVIPIGLVLVVGAVGLAAWFDPLRILSRLPTGGAGMVISGTKITMASPKLSGYTRDSRWYELSARAAAQDITKPDIVELQEIRAKLEMQDKATLNLTAFDGLFNRKAGVLTLGREVLLQSSSGYEVRLSQAVVDTTTGNIVSEKPVEVKMQQGTLNANRLEVSNAGEVVRFDGGVVMNLVPAPAEKDAGKAVKP